MAGDLGQRAGHLDPRGAGTHHGEGEPGVAFRRVDVALGSLVGEQHAAPDLERVFQGLETRGSGCPLVMAEITVRRTGGDNEVVVADVRTVLQENCAALHVDPRGLGHHHGEVVLAAQDMTYRCSDRRRGQPRGSDLIEQGLKQVVVAAVQQRDAYLRTGKPPGRRQPAEAAAEDHHMRRVIPAVCLGR